MLKNIQKRQYLVLSILIIFTSFVLYRRFILGNNTLVYRDWGYDTFHQYLPAYEFYSRNLNFSPFNFSYGLGTSIFTSLAWIADPFSILSAIYGAIFGADKIASILVYIQILKSICAGLLCLYYLKKKGFSSISCIISSYVYSFCGYMIATGQHYFFAVFPVYFILLLIFIDKAFKDSKHLISLAIVVALICIRSPYNAYMMLLAGAVYALLKAFYSKDRFSVMFKKILSLGASVLTGLLISMISFLPQAMEIMSLSNRVSQGSFFTKIIQSFEFLPLSYLKTGFLRFFSNNLQGSVNHWQGVVYHFSAYPYFYSALFILFAVQFIINTFRKSCNKKSRILRLIIISLFIFSMVNGFIPELFNMFAGAEFRYLFIVLPLFAYIMAESLDKAAIHHEFSRPANYITIGISILGILKYSLPLINADSSIKTTMIATICTLLVGGVLFDLLYVISLKHQNNQNAKKSILKIVYICLCVCICANLFIENNTILYQDRTICTKEWLSSKNQATDYQQAVAAADKIENSNFYRIDATDYMPNCPDALYSLIIPSRTVSFYNTIVNSNTLTYINKMFGNSTTYMCIYSRGSYGSVMDAVTASNLGIKYLVSAQQHDCIDWKLVGKYGNSYLYENQLIKSAALIYDQYTTENEANNFSQADRQLGMAQTVILDSSPKDINLYAQHVSQVICDDNNDAIDFSSIKGNNLEYTVSDDRTITGNAKSQSSIEIPLRSDLINVSGQQNQLDFKIKSSEQTGLSITYNNGTSDFTLTNSIDSKVITPDKETEISATIPSDAHSITIHIENAKFAMNNMSLRKSQIGYNSSVQFDNPGMNGVVSGTVSLQKSALLYMPIPYENGWTATIDGKTVEILKANYGFQSILVPQGVHTIKFEYKNVYLQYGGILSIIGLIILAAWLLVLFKKSKK